MLWVRKIVPLVIVCIILGAIIWFVEPPKTITDYPTQISLFFIPFFLILVFSLNLFLKCYPRSITIAIGLSVLLSLQALSYLNIYNFIIIVTGIFLVIKFLKKPKISYQTKIPKLSHLKKQRWPFDKTYRKTYNLKHAKILHHNNASICKCCSTFRFCFRDCTDRFSCQVSPVNWRRGYFQHRNRWTWIENFPVCS